MSTLQDYFDTLYAFCGGMQQPVNPTVAHAFNTFIRAFGWLCPSLVDAEAEWGQPICIPHDVCPFEPVATIHEWVAPESFQGEQLVQKYLVQGVPKEEWGHKLWRLLHHSSRFFTPDEMYSILQACKHLLPCPQCRNHLSQLLDILTPSYCEKCDQFVSDVHNIVNVRLNKPVHGAMSPYAQHVSTLLNKNSR
jgi:hypothetical protein